MAEADVNVEEQHRVSFVWIVPIIAFLLGIGMVFYTFSNRGPEVKIVFDNAEGLKAEKTAIKVRAVDVGVVESVELSDSVDSVVVNARLHKEAKDLLREDTQFWVVRPRIGKSGISGLGTLLAGAHIELTPGSGKPGRREFIGLEDPPVAPSGAPGLKIELVTSRAESLGIGDPILYKGFVIGRIESIEFDSKKQELRLNAFIAAPHDDLITTATRFWNASGITVSVGSDGVEVGMASFESLLQGGVEMGMPDGLEAGAPVPSGAVFELYPDFASVTAKPYRHTMPYVVQFSQSVRGLKPGAPVEFRGIPAGRVDRILMNEVARQLQNEGETIPVLIQLEPGRLELPDSAEGEKVLANAVEGGVADGLRATLATGSLITGGLYVSLDLFRGEEAKKLGSFAGYPAIPTLPSGLGGLEQKLGALLDKINRLPLEKALADADRVLADLDVILSASSTRELPSSVTSTLGEVRTTLASFSEDSVLQQRVMPTLDELDRTLASLRKVLDTIEQTPNALIFNREVGKDPQPPVGTR